MMRQIVCINLTISHQPRKRPEIVRTFGFPKELTLRKERESTNFNKTQKKKTKKKKRHRREIERDFEERIVRAQCSTRLIKTGRKETK